MNLGMPEMLFIGLLALLIFGPRKLPEIAREVGKFMAEFKRAGNEFKHQIESEIQQIELEEQIKKDAERREVALKEAEAKRLASETPSEDQGELFDVPDSPKLDAMPRILPPEGTVANRDATPASSFDPEHAPIDNSQHQAEPNA